MIKRIELINFRKFGKVSFNINNQFVILSGDNAVGKTSILEAIYFTSVTKSLRTSNVSDLIKYNKEYSVSKITTDKDVFKVAFSNTGKGLFINNKEVKKNSDYLGNLKTIFFTPSELEIINGAPSIRRQVLNLEISQLEPFYVGQLTKYNKLIKERNLLLKSENVDRTYLDILTSDLVVVSLKIMEYRKRFISDINLLINRVHQKFNKDEFLEIQYQNNLPFDNTLEFMNSKIERDIFTQSTNYGISRDDLVFMINNRDAKSYASQGQIRSYILSFKLALVLLIKKYTFKYPVLLLDDVLSELDITRKNSLLEIIFDLGQTFISCTDVNSINLDLLKNFQKIEIKKGVE